jgi:hypothetical protein
MGMSIRVNYFKTVEKCFGVIMCLKSAGRSEYFNLFFSFTHLSIAIEYISKLSFVVVSGYVAE